MIEKKVNAAKDICNYGHERQLHDMKLTPQFTGCCVWLCLCEEFNLAA